MAVLRSRLLEMEQAKAREAGSTARRLMVGGGDRSEKVRTYNFPQDRVTDHRIGLDLHNLPGVLDGDLDRLIDALITTDQAERLRTLGRGDLVTPAPRRRPCGSVAPAVAIVPATDLGSVQVLKHGNLFLLTDHFGDIHPDSRGLGLYNGDTRILSCSALRINGIRPSLLQASAGGNYRGTVQLTNPEFPATAARSPAGAALMPTPGPSRSGPWLAAFARNPARSDPRWGADGADHRRELLRTVPSTWGSSSTWPPTTPTCSRSAATRDRGAATSCRSRSARTGSRSGTSASTAASGTTYLAFSEPVSAIAERGDEPARPSALARFRQPGSGRFPRVDDGSWSGGSGPTSAPPPVRGRARPRRRRRRSSFRSRPACQRRTRARRPIGRGPAAPPPSTATTRSSTSPSSGASPTCAC